MQVITEMTGITNYVVQIISGKRIWISLLGTKIAIYFLGLGHTLYPSSSDPF